MLNRDIISVSVPVLKPGQTVGDAMAMMTDLHVAHLPVVDKEDHFTGLISEDILLNAAGDDLPVAELQPLFSHITVNANTHFLEAVQLVNEYNLTLIPVTEKDLEYIGSVTAADLLQQLGKITGANLPGAVIVIEMDKVSFSFSEISKLVETNDAQITQLNTFIDPHTAVFYLTLKINKLEISDIIATFQRYEYKIKYYFGEELYENELRSNYDHLMNYLSI